MESWQRTLAASLADPAELAELFSLDTATMAKVAGRYPLRITRSYLELIERPGDPIWLQCVPDPRELADDQSPDPLNEEGLSPVPSLIHRYPDRVVWLVSNVCAVYCRFCMRKRRVGCAGVETGRADRERALDYIAAIPTVRDVVLSGGDPLLLADDTLHDILGRLRRIPHVEIVRIGTRAPVTLPERITPALCRILKEHHPVYVTTHFNHPREITAAATAACGRLADAGIQLANQTVLLKGVNDDPAVMAELMRRLLAVRVRPYYLHQMDLVRGTRHFRTSIATGLEIMAALRGQISGLAVPQYVVDLPGGKGKVPLLPEYAERRDGRLFLRNYRGEEVEYPDAE